MTEIGSGLEARDSNTVEIDARGRLILPGGIDPHVHLGGARADDYASGSAAALAGGITTFSNFSPVRDGETLVEAVEREARLVRRQSMADVIVHPIVSDPETVTPDSVEALAEAGHTSLKVFMVRRSFDQNASGFVTAMAAARAAGVLLMMHAEDAAIIQATGEHMLNDGRGSLRYFADARPVAAEVAATERAMAMAEVTDTPVYLVHLSSEGVLHVAERARSRGVPVYVETRPIYLHLTRERFEGPTPGLYIGQPPLRTRRDQDALWDGLGRGAIQVVATDHVAYTREEKLDPAQTVVRHRAGMSNLQVMLPDAVFRWRPPGTHHAGALRRGHVDEPGQALRVVSTERDRRRRVGGRPRGVGSERDAHDSRRGHAVGQRILGARRSGRHRLAGGDDTTGRGRLSRPGGPEHTRKWEAAASRPVAGARHPLAARGETPAAFDRRESPPRGVAPPSNMANILHRRAWRSGLRAALGAPRGFHHGLLAAATHPARRSPRHTRSSSSIDLAACCRPG